jgi:predicted CopG family antitoxin
MTNILTNINNDDVQTHIDKAHDLIDKYLPTSYVDEVLKKLPEGHSISKGMIRNVRARKNDRLEVLNALVEVAKENQAQIEKLIKLTA